MKNQESLENNFHKLVGIGKIDYNYSLNLTKDETLKLNFDIEKVKTIKEVFSILDLEALKNKIFLDSCDLVTFLSFINKTNSNKVLTEYLSLNLLVNDKELMMFEEKIKNDFDDNFLFLVERDILTKRNLSLSINIEGKSFIFTKEGKIEKCLDELNKPKWKNNDLIVNNLEIPNAVIKENNKSKQIYFKDLKENIGQMTPVLLTNYSKFRIKNNLNDSNQESLEKNINYKNIIPSALALKLNYDFDTCEFVIIDLNHYVNNNEISLAELLDFLSNSIIHYNPDTIIVTIFPSMVNVKKDLNSVLLDIISLSTFTIYERIDAIDFCTKLGYILDQSNFEEKFICLKDITRAGKVMRRTSLFFDNFEKLIVISLDVESRTSFKDEFKFNFGIKINFFKAISLHYKFLKAAFLGGFFSSILRNSNSFEIAFDIGLSTLKKVLNILDNNNQNYYEPENPDFFVYKNDKTVKKIREYYKSTNTRRIFELSKSNNNIIIDNQQTFLPRGKIKLSKIKNDKISSLESLGQTQRKFMGILQSNQILERKLNKLLSKSPINDQYRDICDLKELNNICKIPFPKIVLKPIEQKSNFEIISNNSINNMPQKLNDINKKNPNNLPGYHENNYHNIDHSDTKMINTSLDFNKFKKEFKDYHYFDKRFKENKYKYMTFAKNDLNSLNIEMNDACEVYTKPINKEEKKYDNIIVPTYKGVYVFPENEKDLIPENQKRSKEEKYNKEQEKIKEETKEYYKKLEKKSKLEEEMIKLDNKKKLDEQTKQKEIKEEELKKEIILHKLKDESNKNDEKQNKKNENIITVNHVKEEIDEEIPNSHFKSNDQQRKTDEIQSALKRTEENNKSLENNIEVKLSEDKMQDPIKLSENKQEKEVKIEVKKNEGKNSDEIEEKIEENTPSILITQDIKITEKMKEEKVFEENKLKVNHNQELIEKEVEKIDEDIIEEK